MAESGKETGMRSSGGDETMGSYGADIGKRTTSWTRFTEWVLVEANRLFIAAVLSIGTFLAVLLLHWIGVIAFVDGDSITRLAGGMIAGTFSLVTLVVSINQLILSQEFAAAGESEDQLENILSFREDVAATTGVPAVPASPTRLLELLIAAIRDRVDGFEAAVAASDDELATDVSRYANRVRESADRIDETLEHTKFGTFRAVSAAIGYDDAWQLYVGRHLRGQYGSQLSPEAADALDDLIEALEQFSVAREHFKTTYLQRELTRFSQLTLYCGVPAILSAMLIGFLYGDLAGPTIGVDYLPVVISGLLAIVVSPLALLTAYILRTATVTRRTASVGPMIPQKDPDEGPFDVSYGQESGSKRTPSGSD